MVGRLHGGRHAESWQRFEVHRIEDLANAVLGADLDVVQMPGGRVAGSLAFAARRGVLFSSGLIEGNVTLYGPLAPDAITIGIGLRFGPNSRWWLEPVRNGDIGVVQPGAPHDASLTAGALYVTATLTVRRLEEEANRQGVVLDGRVTSCTGRCPRPITGTPLTALTHKAADLHLRRGDPTTGHDDVGGAMLHAVIDQCARCQRTSEVTNVSVSRDVRTEIVSRARRYVGDHLATPLTLDAIARAAGTSRPTLTRAFVEVLDDTPADYVRRLRLHRIRRDLTSHDGARKSIATIAARWGFSESSRMARWYREVFDEWPGETRVAAVAHRRRTDRML